MNGFVAWMLVLFGLLISFTVVGAIIGIPLMMWGSKAIKQKKFDKAVAKAINKQKQM